MTTAKPGVLKQAEHKASRNARRAASGGWVEGLERWGYIMRGLLYIIMGGLALQLALGAGGKTTDPIGAIRYLAGQPYGKVLLAAMVVGLAGYSLWGLFRGLFDALDKGSDAKGLAQRAGYLVSALSYGALILPTWQLLTSQAAGGQAGNPRDVTAQLMTKPYGVALVFAFGLFWIVAAASQLYLAVTAGFMRDLSARHMGAEESRWAKVIGRIGYTARFVVYGLLGVFILQAAFSANAQDAQGIDGVLAKLSQTPYGPWVLGVVALGLVVFGVYSAMSARWYSIEPKSHG